MNGSQKVNAGQVITARCIPRPWDRNKPSICFFHDDVQAGCASSRAAAGVEQGGTISNVPGPELRNCTIVQKKLDYGTIFF
jgi:hypothetical protein